MYTIRCNDKVITSAQLQRHMSDALKWSGDDQRFWNALCSIESLESRGARYANHDFDVLNNALTLAVEFWKGRLDELRVEFDCSAGAWEQVFEAERHLTDLGHCQAVCYDGD